MGTSNRCILHQSVLESINHHGIAGCQTSFGIWDHRKQSPRRSNDRRKKALQNVKKNEKILRSLVLFNQSHPTALNRNYTSNPQQNINGSYLDWQYQFYRRFLLRSESVRSVVSPELKTTRVKPYTKQEREGM